MKSVYILAFFALFAVALSADNPNCQVTLPRLLIGDAYYSQTSKVTALIVFETQDECKGTATLNFDKDAPSFNFVVIDPVLQKVDAKLSHNGKNEEQVKYQKYTQVIQLMAEIQKEYTVQIQGNKDDETTIFATKYTFTLPKSAPTDIKYNQNQIKFMFFGDQDLTQNGTAVLQSLNANTQNNKFDAMIFLGDYAYEFYQNNGEKGDQYVEQLAPLSFSYPLAMTPGNHEDNLNFTIFNSKFFLPGYNKTFNYYNSFTLGLVHFVHINLHFYSITTDDEKAKMLKWLKMDLSAASQPSQRKYVPWIIAVGHKLNYCYDPNYANNKECIGYAQQFLPIDTVLNQYGVDLFIVGHQHYNQVMAPMAHNQLQDYKNTTISADEFNIKKGKGYITIIQGNGGCYIPATPPPSNSRILDLASDLKKASLYFNSNNYGYGYIHVQNQTSLKYISYDAINKKELVTFNIMSQHQSSSAETYSNLISFSLAIILALLAAF